MQKHTRKPNRLSGYDYSLPGYYYVTVCTKNMVKWFGRFVVDEVRLSTVGRIAKRKWLEIPKHFDSIDLDEFIIMPNHVHGIIIVKNVGNGYIRSLRARQNQLLPTVIGTYKAAVTREVFSKKFQWQKSYYDHIIRSQKSLDNIRHYIRYNVLKNYNEKKHR